MGVWILIDQFLVMIPIDQFWVRGPLTSSDIHLVPNVNFLV